MESELRPTSAIFREEAKVCASPKEESKRLLGEKAGFESSHGEDNKRSLKKKVRFESSHGEENKSLSGEKAGFESFHGDENKCLFGDASGVDPETKNKQSKLRRRARKKAGIDSSHGEKNKRLRPFGFACPDCCDFELELGKDALKHFQGENEDTGEYEFVQVLGACFAFSWSGFILPNSKELCHISFSAKPKNNGDVSLKWFFAEFRESGDGGFRPSRAEMLDPYDNGIRYGCKFCPPHLLYPHPPGSLSRYIAEHGGGRKALDFRHHHKQRVG